MGIYWWIMGREIWRWKSLQSSLWRHEMSCNDVHHEVRNGVQSLGGLLLQLDRTALIYRDFRMRELVRKAQIQCQRIQDGIDGCRGMKNEKK